MDTASLGVGGLPAIVCMPTTVSVTLCLASSLCLALLVSLSLSLSLSPSLAPSLLPVSLPRLCFARFLCLALLLSLSVSSLSLSLSLCLSLACLSLLRLSEPIHWHGIVCNGSVDALVSLPSHNRTMGIATVECWHTCRSPSLYCIPWCVRACLLTRLRGTHRFAMLRNRILWTF